MVARYEVYGAIEIETGGVFLGEARDMESALEILKEYREKTTLIWVYDTKEGITVHKERRGR
jgi:hypothetical protein